MSVAWALDTRIGKSTTGALYFSQIRAGSPRAPVMDVKESGEDKENTMLPASSFRMTGLVVGQWWSGEAYPWRDAQTSTVYTINPSVGWKLLFPLKDVASFHS